MKQLTAITIAFLFSIHLFSQDEWAQDSAIWHYQCWSVFSPPTLYQYYTDGDTVIQGVNCKRLKYLQQEFYTHEDNGKVFIYNPDDSTFGQLYDFKAQVGDQWKIRISENLFWPFDSITVDVFGVVDREVSGKSIKTQLVRFYDDEGNYYGTDSIFENIGSVRYLTQVFRMVNEDSIVNEGGPCKLHCFWLSNTLAINFHGHECIISSDDEKLKEETLFSIAPNPATDFLYISFQNNPPIHRSAFHIFDTNGRLVKKHIVEPSTYELHIPLAGIPTGLYLLKYLENGEVKGVERLVISK